MKKWSIGAYAIYGLLITTMMVMIALVPARAETVSGNGSESLSVGSVSDNSVVSGNSAENTTDITERLEDISIYVRLIFFFIVATWCYDRVRFSFRNFNKLTKEKK